jgi:predicted dehydrogenase
MKKIVLILGAGSIGNHMTNACLKLNYQVFVSDISQIALKRMKKKIFPKRYGKWDNSIKLVEYSKVFLLEENFDLIIIGTPPKTHLNLSKKISECLRFKRILVEKPLSTSLVDFDKFNILNKNNKVFCGYNHSVTKSFQFFFEQLKKNKNKITHININWCEGWKNILNAHFWLKDEFESYLGSTKRGGGSLHEHSHGLHLSVVILEKIYGENFYNSKGFTFKKNSKKKKVSYDYLSNINFQGKKISLIYNTDLLSDPAQKSIEAYGDDTQISWYNNFSKNSDVVIFKNKMQYKKKTFFKNRSSDFINEIKHLESLKTKKGYKNSNLNLDLALKTMSIIKKFVK